MGGSREDLLHEILFLRAHASYAASASVLAPESGDRAAFDISAVRHSDNGRLVGYQIFHLEIVRGARQRGATFVAVALLEVFQFVYYEADKNFLVGQYAL